MPPVPDHPTNPAVMQDILHPQKASKKKTLPKPRQADNAIAATAVQKSSLNPSANERQQSYTLAPALTIPQHRFGSYSRDDLVWLTAGSLTGMLVMTCVATLTRLGISG